ncbi:MULTISPECIES: leucine-rich repeat domain-containing protein [unclassified Methanosarcina]|uniref:leucine-rich repeat domain-containing protein n=1 Tax=unclassified Methanosarcina TaxID=2644672 RepID=UPI0035102ACF
MQLIREAYERYLTTLNLSGNQLTQLPPEIKELKNLTRLYLSSSQNQFYFHINKSLKTIFMI